MRARNMRPGLRSGWNNVSGVIWAGAALVAASTRLLVPEPGDLEAGAARELITMTGCPALLVSDSMGHYLCPWPMDRYAIPAKSAAQLRDAFGAAIAGHHYEQIVLWPGSADFVLKHEPTEYVQALMGMVPVARAHADTVVVLGPMPYGPREFELFLATARDEWGAPPAVLAQTRRGMPPDVRAAVATGVGMLQGALPDVPIYDLAEFWSLAHRHPDVRRYYRDGFHPSGLGYRIIQTGLAEMGHPLRLPSAGRQAYFSIAQRVRYLRTEWFRFLAMAGDRGPRPLDRAIRLPHPANPSRPA